MADEAQTATPAPEAAPAPAPAPDVDWKAKAEALERTKSDLLAEVKKLKGNSRAAEEATKTAEQWQAEAKRAKASASVYRALASEGIKPETDDEAEELVGAILGSKSVEIGDDGVKGVSDALKTLRKLLGGTPATAKPEASPAMAKPKANAEPIDPKFGNVNTRRELIAMGAAAFNEFTAKYPDRYAALR